MIVWLILAAAQAASPPAAPARESWCRGVAIETRDGGRANFIGITAEGNDESLRRFRAAADARRFHAVGPSVGLMGRVRVSVTFETHRNRPGSTNPEEALDFLRRAETGEYGQLRIRRSIMSIDTLPADLC